MNALIEIAKEDTGAYCVSPQTIQIAINRGISKEAICVAMIEIMGNNPEGFYLEDERCCAFVAYTYEKD